MISRITLRLRMIVLFCVVVGALIIGIYLAVYTTFASGVEVTRFDRMVDRSRPLIALLQYPGGPEMVENLDLHNQSFEVFDNQGGPLYKSNGMRDRNLPQPDFTDRSHPVFATLPSSIGSIRVATIPIEIQGKPAWFVLAERTTTIDSIEAGFRRKFMILGAIIIVVTALLATWYVMSSLQPIIVLTKEAEQLTSRISATGRHKPSPKLPVHNPFDEVGRLATTFNVLFERLDSVLRQLQLFVSDAAHELRTPLAVLRGETQLLLSRPHSPVEYRQSLQTLDSELAAMGRIIEGLFTLSMADAGQLKLHEDDVYLDEILDESCGIAAALAREKNIQIAKLGWKEHQFRGDQVMLRQLFLILIENAVKYSPSDSTIWVDLKEVEGRPSVTVADEGIGIAADDLPHIFKRFYRAAPQPNEGARSGGLGLAIAQAIVETHHGSITCESTKGAGSRFTVSFEARQEAKTSESSATIR
jgi:two-component system OmpR family sensor kinase